MQIPPRMTPPVPRFGTLELKERDGQMEFKFSERNFEESTVTLNGKGIGRSIHAQFPYNNYANIARHSEKQGDAIASLGVTLLEALNAVRTKAPPVIEKTFQTLRLRQLSNRPLVSRVKATSDRELTGQILT